MKTIGIIGGLGPESTVDYYKEIIAAFNAKYVEMTYPEIITQVSHPIIGVDAFKACVSESK